MISSETQPTGRYLFHRLLYQQHQQQIDKAVEQKSLPAISNYETIRNISAI